MKIGIVSDTHGRQPALREALEVLRSRGVGLVLHCGDVGEEATVRLFAGWTAHLVFGNNDVDRESMCEAAAEVGVTFHDPYGYLEVEGRKLAFLHGDDSRLLAELAGAGSFDFVFHGHTHHPSDRRVGSTRVINPGALHRARPRTFATLDLATEDLNILVVE